MFCGDRKSDLVLIGGPVWSPFTILSVLAAAMRRWCLQLPCLFSITGKYAAVIMTNISSWVIFVAQQ